MTTTVGTTDRKFVWALFVAIGADRDEAAEITLATVLKKSMDASVRDLPKHHLIFCPPDRWGAGEQSLLVRTRVWGVRPELLFPRSEPPAIHRDETGLALARWYMDEVTHVAQQVAQQGSSFAVCAEASEIELILGFAYTLAFRERAGQPPAAYAPFQMQPGSVALVRVVMAPSTDEASGATVWRFVDLDQAIRLHHE